MHLLSDIPEPTFLHTVEDWQGNRVCVPAANKCGLSLMLSPSVVSFPMMERGSHMIHPAPIPDTKPVQVREENCVGH